MAPSARHGRMATAAARLAVEDAPPPTRYALAHPLLGVSTPTPARPDGEELRLPTVNRSSGGSAGGVPGSRVGAGLAGAVHRVPKAFQSAALTAAGPPPPGRLLLSPPATVAGLKHQGPALQTGGTVAGADSAVDAAEAACRRALEQLGAQGGSRHIMASRGLEAVLQVMGTAPLA